MRILALLLLSVPVWAATRIQDTLYVANGQLASGTVVITPSSAFTTASGRPVLKADIVVPIVAGALDVTLEPNEGSDPSGTAYTAKFYCGRTWWTETWVVPAGALVDLKAVRKSSTLVIFLGQLDQAEATDGQCMIYSVTAGAWTPMNCVAGGANATQLQTRALAATPPSDGQVIRWNAASSTWEPATVGSGDMVASTYDPESKRTQVLTISDFGATAGKVAQGNDARLSDPRPPTNHASNHPAGASDPLLGLRLSQIDGADKSGLGTRIVLLGGTAPTDGQGLLWDQTAGYWKAGTVSGGGGGVSWGSIPGTLSDQIDLSNALANKASLSHLHLVADITGLTTVAATGSYNDLSNKPTIPAAQVNSDWNAVSGLALILNKPTLGAAAAMNVGQVAGTVAGGDHGHGGVYEPVDTNIIRSTGSYSDPAWLTLTKSKVGLGNVTNEAQIPLSQKAAASGVASLDASTKIPIAQVPTGTGASNVALGNHAHGGVYEPVDATILRQVNLAGSGAATTPAKSDHNHTGTYEPAIAAGSKQGTGTKFQMSTGAAPAANTVTVYDANGNIVGNSNSCQITASGLTCGDGTASAGISLPELAASGHGTSFSIYGADSQSVSGCIIMPVGSPTNGQGLYATASTATTTDGKTCRVMEWLTGGGGAGDMAASVYDPAGKAAQVLTISDFGATAGKVAQGDDARLSDARAPVPHTLLGAYHSDANAAASPTRGSLPVHGPSVWDNLPVGSQYGILQVLANNDLGWGPLHLDQSNAVTGQLPPANIASLTAFYLAAVPGTGALMVNNGIPQKVAGGSTDCVQVNGSSTPCGSSGSPGIGRATLSATWTAINDTACQDQAITWNGVTTADTIALGSPAGLPAGLLATAVITDTSTVNIRLCNSSGAAVTPGAQNFQGTLSTYTLVGSSVLNFGAVPDSACSTLTFSLSGAASGDSTMPGWPSTLEAGLSGTIRVSATDTLEVRLCNFSGAAIDPASQTFRASIAK